MVTLSRTPREGGKMWLLVSTARALSVSNLWCAHHPVSFSPTVVIWIRNVPHRFRHLNMIPSWSHGLESLGGTALLQEVHHRGRLWDYVALPFLPFSALCVVEGVSFQVPAAMPASCCCMISCPYGAVSWLFSFISCLWPCLLQQQKSDQHRSWHQRVGLLL